MLSNGSAALVDLTPRERGNWQPGPSDHEAIDFVNRNFLLPSLLHGRDRKGPDTTCCARPVKTYAVRAGRLTRGKRECPSEDFSGQALLSTCEISGKARMNHAVVAEIVDQYA
jgi:hypothetical protein